MKQGLGYLSLQLCRNEHDGISNHQPHDCLLNRLFWHRWKKTSKLRITDLWEGNSPVTSEFPAQRGSNAEHVSIWWHHQDRCSGGWCNVGHPSETCLKLLLGWIYFSETSKYICNFNYISILSRCRLMQSFLEGDTELFILHSQHHCCWYPGYVRRQAINRHGFEQVILEYFRFFQHQKD